MMLITPLQGYCEVLVLIIYTAFLHLCCHIVCTHSINNICCIPLIQPVPDRISFQSHPLTHPYFSNKISGNLSDSSHMVKSLYPAQTCVLPGPLPGVLSINLLSPRNTQQQRLQAPAPPPTWGQKTIKSWAKTRDRLFFQGVWGGEDLPSGEVEGLAPWWLLSPFRGSSVPLFLILRLPISRLLRQPHRGSRAMFSRGFCEHIKGRQRRHWDSVRSWQKLIACTVLVDYLLEVSCLNNSHPLFRV